MEAFRPTGSGGASASFAAPEAALLRSLIDQVVGLLSGPEAGEPPSGGPDGGGFDLDAPPGAADRGAPDAGDPGAAELDAMLGAGEPVSPPEDPALARLLPDAYRDDPGAAGEFRRYTEQSLRSAKQETARTVLETLPAEGGPVELSGDQAQSWLRALNDVRLALGVRLGVTEEFEDQWQELDPLDPRSAAFEVYAWLGSVQESLVQALA
jgi:hypothetical protein